MSGSSSPVDYGALADTVDISDITFDRRNREILHLLKDDDPYFSKLIVGNNDYVVEDARSMGVLGHYLGRSAHVTHLCIAIGREFDDDDVLGPFLLGLERNRSIQKLSLVASHITCEFSRLLTAFINGNPNLTGLRVEQCGLNAEQCCAFSLALREGKSLKEVWIDGGLVDGQYQHEQSIIDNVEALKMHPQLESLFFGGFVLGRNACAALSDLLQQVSAGMQQLCLNRNNIDDSGIEALVDGLAHCRCLRQLQLATNPSITARGWRALSSLLEDPNSRLPLLNLMGNGIDDEIAVIFANALAHNKWLERLYIGRDSEEVTGESWKAFSNVLCDTTNVNSTYLSNHTLHRVGPKVPIVPEGVALLLSLNKESNKLAVAIRKILLHHDDFDMQPLFEWDLKVLPFVIQWFERSAFYGMETLVCNQKRKLAAIFQFTRGMPELAIDGIAGASKKSAQTGK